MVPLAVVNLNNTGGSKVKKHASRLHSADELKQHGRADWSGVNDITDQHSIAQYAKQLLHITDMRAGRAVRQLLRLMFCLGMSMDWNAASHPQASKALMNGMLWVQLCFALFSSSISRQTCSLKV